MSLTELSPAPSPATYITLSPATNLQLYADLITDPHHNSEQIDILSPELSPNNELNPNNELSPVDELSADENLSSDVCFSLCVANSPGYDLEQANLNCASDSRIQRASLISDALRQAESPAATVNPLSPISSLSQELSSPCASSNGDSESSEHVLSQTSCAASPAPAGSSTPLRLPPCRVCGERASGFHYGVNTCEACKGFFRRSLQRKGEYKCNENGNCVIAKGKRNFCPHCRYKKCITVGMSKTAIKTGRYTHAKRTKDIQEVKRIEKQLKGGVVEDSPPETQTHHQEMITALMNARKENPYYEPQFLEKLKERQAKYLKEYEYRKQIFGLNGGISQLEYKEFFKKTGIDIDGRRQMLSFWIPLIETAIRKYITFAKAIPGFKELPVEDQISLIKAARFEVWFLSNFRGYNQEQDIFTGTSGTTYHIEELSRVHDMEFLKCCFRLARRLQKYNLTEMEITLMQAAVIFFSDRCPLKERAAVEALLLRLIDILQIKVKELYPDRKHMFANLMNFFTDLRVITAMNEDESEKLKLIVCDMDIPVPPLIIEMCT